MAELTKYKLSQEKRTSCYKEEEFESKPNYNYNNIGLEKNQINAVATTSNNNKSGARKFLGIALALAAGLTTTTANIAAKYLSSQKYNTFYLSFVKYQGMTTIGLLYCLYLQFYKKERFIEAIWPVTKAESRKNILFIFLRTTFGVGGTILIYYSYLYMTVADSAVIVYSNSILVVFLAALFLKEPLGIIPVACSFLAVIGVFIIGKPPMLFGGVGFDSQLLIGICFAVTSLICVSFIFVTLRYMRAVHYALFMTLYGYGGSLEVFLISIPFIDSISSTFIVPKSAFDAGMMSIVALLNLFGQTLAFLAFKYEAAGPISIVRTFDIIFSFILQFIFFGTAPQLSSLIGASIIIFASIIIGLRKWTSGLDEKAPWRRKLRVLLL